MEQTQPTKVLTGLIRFSYPNVFKPKAIADGAEAKYSCNLIIKKSDKETLAKIEKAVKAAIAAKWPEKKPAKLKLPLRDGDEEKPEDEAYAGCFFLAASGKSKPGLVDRDLDEITDPADFYSGCYGRASLNFFAFDTAGNKGVGAGLNNLQKLKDGEALSSSISAKDDFAAAGEIEIDEDDSLL